MKEKKRELQVRSNKKPTQLHRFSLVYYVFINAVMKKHVLIHLLSNCDIHNVNCHVLRMCHQGSCPYEDSHP